MGQRRGGEGWRPGGRSEEGEEAKERDSERYQEDDSKAEVEGEEEEEEKGVREERRRAALSPSPAPADSDEGWGPSDGEGEGGEEDDDDDDWGDAVELDPMASSADYPEHLNTPAPFLRKHVSYTIITAADLPRLQSAMINRVASTLAITPSSAATLLRHCHWDDADTVRLFEVDHHQLATDAGVATQLHSDVSQPLDPCSTITCWICFEDVAADRTFALPCAHSFCVGCWKEYLRAQIEGGDVTGKNALATRCPHGRCKEVMGMEAWEMILDEDDAQLLSKYRQMLVRSFVDDSKSCAWCPKVGCDRIVAHSQRRSTIECACGHQFCFGCKGEAHAPAECAEALSWTARDKGTENLDTKWQAAPHTRTHRRQTLLGSLCMSSLPSPVLSLLWLAAGSWSRARRVRSAARGRGRRVAVCTSCAPSATHPGAGSAASRITTWYTALTHRHVTHQPQPSAPSAHRLLVLFVRVLRCAVRW